MRSNKFLILIFVVCFVGLLSCNKHAQLLKSTDNDLKYQAAISYYESKDYNRALQLFEVLQSAFRGKPQGEDVAFYTAECYYKMRDYEIASHYYKRFVVNYPFSKRAESSLFRSACCYYLESPKISLDQSQTYTAISELQSFLNLYPKSEYADSANVIIDTLKYKLQEKDFNTCMLYYKMDEYQAAITSFEDFVKEYSNTHRREEIMNYMVLTYYNYALNSVEDKQRERYELALEKYNTLTYMYPDSKYIKELESIVNKINQELTNYKTK